jgi:hypothetical protein
MDYFHGKTLAIDGATVTSLGALGSSPWWMTVVDSGAHLALIALALGIGALRFAIALREWRRSRRRGLR